MTQADINILLTRYLKPDSRIQIWRDVKERVAQVAPFLKLEIIPYPVLSEGKLYWIQDAYTTSAGFPYSNPHSTDVGNGLNYIRNSVKITINMYDGKVAFYVMDPHDPVLAVYQSAFPGVFQNRNSTRPGAACSNTLMSTGYPLLTTTRRRGWKASSSRARSSMPVSAMPASSTTTANRSGLSFS